MEADAASALTGLLITGLNGCTCALVTLRAARLLRLAPPTLVKEPPTYTVLPETAIDRTSPSAAAVQDVRSQVATSIAASRVRTWAFPDRSWTWVKVPPMKRVPPLIAMALTRPFGWAHGRTAVGATAAMAADAPPTTRAVVQSAANGSRVRMEFPQC